MPHQLSGGEYHQESSADDVIVGYLLDARGHVSGEDIAGHLGVSRTAVWQHVNRLKELGFRIESQPHLGYRLVNTPDRLLPVLVRRGLGAGLMGRRVIHFERATSTSDEADRLARGGEPEGTVVIAEEQTAGRGRVGRAWHSPPRKGIYLSIVLRPSIPPGRAAFLTLCSAISATEAIRKCCGVNAAVKWPNDVLIGGRKVCGILTELVTEADRINYAIVGVGINVNQEKLDFPGSLNATSLKIETRKDVARLSLVQAFLESLDRTYGLLREERYAEIIDRWLRISETVGRRIRAESFSGEAWEGIATGLDEDGCLLLRLDSGLTKRITGGDVSIV